MKRWLLLLLVGVGAVSLSACSSDLKKPPVATSDGDSGIALPPSGGSTGRADAGVDAEAGSDAGACTALAQLGNFVDQVSYPAQLPTPAGGTITDGTYRLTEQSIYNPGQPGGVTGLRVQATLLLSAGNFETIIRTSASAAESSSGTYVTSGNQMTTTTTCPTGRTPRTFGYTATAGQIQLIFTASNEVATYTRQ
jgi:hypothetical protein